MIVIDTHLDLSLNALNWNRDLTLPVAEIRLMEVGMTQQGRGNNTVAFPEMRHGEIAICLATVLARANPRGKSYIDFRNQEIASAMAQGQLAYYRMVAAQGHLRQLRDWHSLEAHLREWNSAGNNNAPLGYVFCMEGADPILSPAHVSFWWDQGLRVVGISHYGVSTYAHGTGISGGLTPRGPDLLKAYGRDRHDSGCHAFSGPSLLAGCGGFQGPAPRQSQQLPRAGGGGSAVQR